MAASLEPRIFLDADILFAGGALPSKFGASYVLLRMGEYTLLDCITPVQAVVEAERNLAKKLPNRVFQLRSIIEQCVQLCPIPSDNSWPNVKGRLASKTCPCLWRPCVKGAAIC